MEYAEQKEEKRLAPRKESGGKNKANVNWNPPITKHYRIFIEPRSISLNASISLLLWSYPTLASHSFDIFNSCH